jgi:hypothetical protein
LLGCVFPAVIVHELVHFTGGVLDLVDAGVGLVGALDDVKPKLLAELLSLFEFRIGDTDASRIPEAAEGFDFDVTDDFARSIAALDVVAFVVVRLDLWLPLAALFEGDGLSDAELSEGGAAIGGLGVWRTVRRRSVANNVAAELAARS